MMDMYIIQYPTLIKIQGHMLSLPDMGTFIVGHLFATRVRRTFISKGREEGWLREGAKLISITELLFI